jgi:hypothetical protein
MPLAAAVTVPVYTKQKIIKNVRKNNEASGCPMIEMRKREKRSYI